MEQLSQEYKNEMEKPSPEVIEIFDLFLTDGTHLRFNSSGEDRQFVDFVE